MLQTGVSDPARPPVTIWPAVRTSPLSHFTRFTAAHRKEYAGIEYGGLPVKYCVLQLMTHCQVILLPNAFRYGQPSSHFP
jgi:hypothetical protein